MLNSRRILIVLFALGLVFPPSWVLCVETSGEVRVERPVVECCDDETVSGGTPVTAARDADNCGDCSDVAVSMSLHRSRLAPDDCASTLVANVFLTGLLPIQHNARARFQIAHLPPPEIVMSLASVVILR